MVYLGQFYRKVCEEVFWEIIEPPRLDHESERFLSKLGSKIIIRVREHDLENRALWVPVTNT